MPCHHICEETPVVAGAEMVAEATQALHLPAGEVTLGARPRKGTRHPSRVARRPAESRHQGGPRTGHSAGRRHQRRLATRTGMCRRESRRQNFRDLRSQAEVVLAFQTSEGRTKEDSALVAGR